MASRTVPRQRAKVAPDLGKRPSGGPLENYANNWTPPPAPETPRQARYERRADLWSMSSLPRVKKCGRVARVPDGLVGVRSHAGVSGFSGLCTCGSVWACPVCNAKVMARRALEVGAAIAAWQAQGGAVVFHTLTMRHRRNQRLETLWDALQGAWAATRAGKVYAKWAARLGLVGYVRAVEVTYGRNGWHVHIHALWFVGGAPATDEACGADGPPDASAAAGPPAPAAATATDAPTPTPADVAGFAGWVHGKWARALVRHGLDAPLRVGQEARLVTGPADADLAAYLSKSTDLGLELTQSQSKRARSSFSTRPTWDLLTDVLDQGDADALDLWHEWEAGSHNRRQITWAQGLRRRLDVGEEKSDEEIAEEEAGGDDLVLITAAGWSGLIARPWLIARVLDAADAGAAALRTFLDGNAVEYIDPSERRSAA